MNIATQILSSFVRHGLTTTSGVLVAKGLPALGDGTVSNLTDLATAAGLFVLSLAWSYGEKLLAAKLPKQVG